MPPFGEKSGAGTFNVSIWGAGAGVLVVDVTGEVTVVLAPADVVQEQAVVDATPVGSGAALLPTAAG